MGKDYNTKQKQILLDAIKSFDCNHFTAEDIYGIVKDKGENIGLATVYRRLDKLSKENFLRKYVAENGKSACYQVSGALDEHFHLICTVCGRMQHLTCKSLDNISSHVKSEHGFSIDPSKTVFYGVCKECAH